MAVIKDLLRRGYSVFTEVGDNSRIDVIAILDGRIRTIQVKCTTSVNGLARLHLKKSTLDPRYNFVYTTDDCDLFALYVEDKDVILYVSSDVALANIKEMKFRFEPPKNGQKKKINFAEDYLKVPE